MYKKPFIKCHNYLNINGSESFFVGFKNTDIGIISFPRKSQKDESPDFASYAAF